MVEQTFSDAQQQLIVKLKDGLLIYAPASDRGWRCRIADICYTTSRLGPHGIQRIDLHGVSGRVVMSINEFEQIGRFYLALLRELLSRPRLDAVRGSIPGQVLLQERVMWLAHQTPLEESWEALAVEPYGAAVATRDGLLLLAAGDRRLQRIAWGELAGARARAASAYFPAGVTRFYRAEDYVEVPVSETAGPVLAACDEHLRDARSHSVPLHEFRLKNAGCASPQLAMDFSWEIEAAARGELLDASETVLACAFGAGRGSLVGPTETVASDRVFRTELFLTDRRLLQVNRDAVTGEVVEASELPLTQLPKARMLDGRLQIGRLELEPDAAQPVAITPGFVREYRSIVATAVDPFTSNVDASPGLQVERDPGADPFAPLVARDLPADAERLRPRA